MKAKARYRFDLDTLRSLAGEKVYARGEAYFREGQVQSLAIGPKRVLAQVSGTDDYRTTLTGRGRDIDGECDCPAFEDWGFCKHMVAVALATNAAGDEGLAGEGTLNRIRNHLKARGIDALVEIIVELAERDPMLLRKLDIAAASMHDDDRALLPRLRKAIDDATRTGRFIHYREASRWAAGVTAVLDTVARLVANGRAGLAQELVEYAIERIEKAIESVDDSDGQGGTLLDHARDIHVAAAKAARPEPVQFARWLFNREMSGRYATFDGALEAYAEVLGEAGLAEYRRLTAEAWDKARAAARGTRKPGESLPGYDRLKENLDFFAARDGDLDARIALRAADLNSQWAHLELSRFCRAHGRNNDALRFAEEGLWMFEDERPDGRLLAFTVPLLLEAGRKTDAQAHLWRAFERAPSPELYRQIRKYGDKTLCERAIAELGDRVKSGRRDDRHNLADVLVSVLTLEKMFAEAWDIVRQHRVSAEEKMHLAKASERRHPGEAVRAYSEHVERLVNGSGHPRYEEAAVLIEHMATLRDAAEQARYVADLKSRFARKRNFMKLLR